MLGCKMSAFKNINSTFWQLCDHVAKLAKINISEESQCGLGLFLNAIQAVKYFKKLSVSQSLTEISGIHS